MNYQKEETLKKFHAYKTELKESDVLHKKKIIQIRQRELNELLENMHYVGKAEAHLLCADFQAALENQLNLLLILKSFKASLEESRHASKTAPKTDYDQTIEAIYQSGASLAGEILLAKRSFRQNEEIRLLSTALSKSMRFTQLPSCTNSKDLDELVSSSQEIYANMSHHNMGTRLAVHCLGLAAIIISSLLILTGSAFLGLGLAVAGLAAFSLSFYHKRKTEQANELSVSLNHQVNTIKRCGVFRQPQVPEIVAPQPSAPPQHHPLYPKLG